MSTRRIVVELTEAAASRIDAEIAAGHRLVLRCGPFSAYVWVPVPEPRQETEPCGRRGRHRREVSGS